MRSSTGNQGGPLGPPPDRATYETLHAVLERRGDEGPTIDEALGMVTALVIGPGLTMPSVWMGWLLGEDSVLDTREEMASFTSAVFTIWNHIAGLDTPEGYRTLIESVETLPGDPRIERFCAGFARAVESDQESWNDQVVHEVIEATESRAGEDGGSADPAPSLSESDSPTVRLLMPILMLASRENPDRRVLGLELPEDWTDDLHTELLHALPSCLDALAYHLRQQRLIDAGIAAHEQPDGYPRPVRRSEPKVGRNDPCPCGSGKKFKRCCGR